MSQKIWVELADPLYGSYAGRQDANMIWDYKSEYYYILNGWDGVGTYTNEIIKSADGINWSYVKDAEYSTRARCNLVYHAFTDLYYVIGGQRGGSLSFEVWSSPDLETWTQVVTTGGPPSVFKNGAAASLGSYIYLLGGHEHDNIYDRVYRSVNGGHWTSMGTGGFGEREKHQAVTVNEEEILIMGGRNGSTVFGDVWSFTGNFPLTKIAGTPDDTYPDILSPGWAPRQDFSIIETYNGTLWLTGGDSSYTPGASAVNTTWADVWQSIDAGVTWDRLWLEAEFGRRRAHVMAFNPLEKVVLLGNGYSNDPTAVFEDMWTVGVGFDCSNNIKFILTEDNVELDSVQVSTTQQVTTRIVANYFKDYFSSSPNQIVFKNNVRELGLHEESYDFYIYNNADAVKKALDFWGKRKSSYWNVLKVAVFMEGIKLELYDEVLIKIHPNIIGWGIKGIITEINYTPDNFSTDLTIVTAAKSGTNTNSLEFWPAIRYTL